MTLAVIWTDDATTDFLDYIAERNVAAADRLETLVQHAAGRLPDHPYIHRPGASPARARRSSTPITSSSIA